MSMSSTYKVRAALAAAMALLRRRPEFLAFVNSPDAMGLHITRYLQRDLDVPSPIPVLVQPIDPRCFAARLALEGAENLERVEEDIAD
jgi:hypothetical protein